MTRNLFWEQPERWPSDPPEWLFLARAAVIVANTVYDGWGDLGIAARWRLADEIASRDAVMSLASKGRTPPPEGELLSSRREELQLFNERFGTVAGLIRGWAEGGALRTGVRDPKGGPVKELDPVCWSTQNLMARFYCCQMKANDPYSPAIFGEGFQHIFVHRAGLVEILKIVESHTAGEPAAQPDQVVLNSSAIPADTYLSPYMRLMLAVIEHQGLSLQNQSTEASIKADIAKLAPSYGLDVNPRYIGEPPELNWQPRPGTRELSNKQLDVMHRLVREPWDK